jgi:hypothetical protein
MQDVVVPSVPWMGNATHHPWVAAQDAIVMDPNLSPSNSSQSSLPPSVG